MPTAADGGMSAAAIMTPTMTSETPREAQNAGDPRAQRDREREQVGRDPLLEFGRGRRCRPRGLEAGQAGQHREGDGSDDDHRHADDLVAEAGRFEPVVTGHDADVGGQCGGRAAAR